MSNTFGKLKLGSSVVKGDILSSCAVKLSSGDLVPCTAVTDLCVGIVHNATNLDAGHYVDVNASGYQIFIAQGAIAVGDDLTMSATVDGALVAAASTNLVVGYAVESAADGEPCRALIYLNKTLAKA